MGSHSPRRCHQRHVVPGGTGSTGTSLGILGSVAPSEQRSIIVGRFAKRVEHGLLLATGPSPCFAGSHILCIESHIMEKDTGARVIRTNHDRRKRASAGYEDVG